MANESDYNISMFFPVLSPTQYTFYLAIFFSVVLTEQNKCISLLQICFNLPHGLEVPLHDGFDECPIALVSVATQSIDYNADTFKFKRTFLKKN